MRSKNKRTILVICPYPQNVAAGQRLKYEQYFDAWRESGFEITVSSFMSDGMWSIAHKKGYLIGKILGTLRGDIKRIGTMFVLRKYDLVYVFMYVSPIGTSLFERCFRFLSKKLVYDLEDNRFLGADAKTKGLAQILRGTDKTRFLVRSADHVITSSPALNEVCLQINQQKQCTYISSSIDTDRFVPTNQYSNEKKVTIGWTGTFSTRPFLDLLRPVFIELKKQRDFKLIVIGNFEYDFPEMDLEVIQWSAEREVEDLQKLDIGVYPLPMDDWVMGKSGLKAIQYMAFGLPCVATDISTVQQFIEDGKNGVLVKTVDEWVFALSELIDSPELRRQIGQCARQTVLEKFSKHVVEEQYLEVLESTVKTSGYGN